MNNFLKSNWILSGNQFVGQQKVIIDKISLNCHFESSIIESIEMQIKLIEILPYKNKINLMFKGTRDGFLSSIFHSKCDNIGSTFSIIKSEHGRIFGFYTNISWSS